MIKTKYSKVEIWVLKNGYQLNFSGDYQGTLERGRAMVAKDLREVKEILAKYLISLEPNKKTNDKIL